MFQFWIFDCVTRKRNIYVLFNLLNYINNQIIFLGTKNYILNLLVNNKLLLSNEQL